MRNARVREVGARIYVRGYAGENAFADAPRSWRRQRERESSEDEE